MSRDARENTRVGLDRWLWLFTLPVSAMLLLSSHAHLDNSFHFLGTVYSYKLVDRWTGMAIAAALPSFQFTLGLALLLAPAARRAALGWCAALFGGLVGVQAVTLARGLNIACGCFGSSSGPIGPFSLGIAGMGFVLSLVGYLICRRPEGRAARVAAAPEAMLET